jgi:hypothetical protein
MSTAPTSTLLRFRGLPDGVECIAPIDLGTNPNEKPSADLFLELPQVAPQTLRVFRLSPGLARLWFSLPSYTPPGSYGGHARIGGSDFRIAVDVDPNENLVFSPPELKIVATRSEKITTLLTLANAGNVVCDIRNTHAFGLFDVEGAERAVGAALRDSAVKGREKIDRLMDSFAEEHAGFVRVLIEAGGGPIAPGEVHELHVTLRFPDNLKAGRTYTGTWVLFNLAYQVRVSANGEEQSRLPDTRHRESKKKDTNDKHNH